MRSLNGRYVDLLEPDDDLPNALVLRPWPLKRALPDMMVDELVTLGVDLTVTQEPDAVVTSDPLTSWLSSVPKARVAVGTQPSDRPPVHRSGRARPSPSPTDATADALVDAIAGVPLTLEAAAGPSGPGGRDELLTSMAASTTRRQEPFGPPHYETGSGLKVRGARVVDVTSTGARIDGWWDDGVRTTWMAASAQR